MYSKALLVLQLLSLVILATSQGTGQQVDLFSAHFADEVYSTGTLQSSYFYSYDGSCLTWSKVTEFTYEDEAKFAIYQSTALGAVVLTFKGSKSLPDFIADADFPFTSCNFGTSCGQVHKGFYDYYNEIRSTIFSTLSSLQFDFTLYVTGHSLGAAQAMLGALDISLNTGSFSHLKGLSLTTFGQPLVGNSDFSNLFNSRNIAYTRYVDLSAGGSHQDIVTTIPPSILGYTHAIDPTYVYCQDCSGVEVTLQLHSMNRYLSELTGEISGVQNCDNGCAVSVASDHIWKYSTVPGLPGCTVSAGSQLSVNVQTLNDDTYAVCLLSVGQIPSYSYSNSKVCGGVGSAVTQKVSQDISTTGSVNTAGSYVVIIENHDLIEFAHLQYDISFTRGIGAPQPPTITNVAGNGNSATVSWNAPSDIGNPALTNYNIYWQPVGEAWQVVSVSGSTTSYTANNLQSGTYYTFVVSSYNGVESDVSNEGSYYVN